MHSPIIVTRVRYKPAREIDRQVGLLGFVACQIDDTFELDGVTLRRKQDGELCLSFPERSDRAGRRHPVLRPLHAETWRLLEDQVFDALRARGVLP